MDRSAWLWSAGAAVCGLLLCLLHPWRAQFRSAREAMRKTPVLWMVPAGAVALEMLWHWRLPAMQGQPLVDGAAVETGTSLVSVLTWLTHGEVLAMLLGAAFLANSAGLRRGLCTGIVAVFPGAWRWVIYLVLLAGAVASLGAPMVRFGAGGETGRWVVKLMAAPWTATAATLLMCWLILAFETACRTPEKSKIRWFEMTGQYTARLWLPAFAGTIAFPLMDWLTPDTRALLRWYAWPAALALAWFPFTALRSTEAGEIHTVCIVALRRWSAGLLSFLGWLAVAGVWFLAFHLLAGWLVSLCPAGSWYHAAVTGVFHTLSAVLAVWMLGAWVAIQVDKVPVSGKQRRRKS
jgi:hypothetical protein